MKKRLALLIGLSGLSLFLCNGCSSYETVLIETVNSKTETQLEKQQLQENPGLDIQNNDLLGKNAAFFFVNRVDHLSPELNQELKTNVFKHLQESDFYSTLKGEEEIQADLQNNLTLDQRKSLYLDSLSTVAVSDKDISNPLGQALQVENLLVFQIDAFPGSTEPENDTLKMKMRLIHAESGAILWTGIHVMNQFSLKTGSIHEKTAYVTNELTRSFYNRFKPKWHKTRFQNLAKN